MKKVIQQAHDTSRAMASKQALLEKSARKNRAAPIRTAFVQRGNRGESQPGPLADLVRNHDDLALDLILLTWAAASAPPYAVHYPAVVWARLLGLPEMPMSLSRISKAWARLEHLGLIKRGKHKRMAEITLLREDGQGGTYTPPGAGGSKERYFKLDFAYWLDEWDTKLTLPAKAVLLIALTLKDGFILPAERASTWYGLSADTIERGLYTLQRIGLLKRAGKRKDAPLSALGYTIEFHYWRQPPFGTSRQASP